MYHHFILIAFSYFQSKRVCFHLVSKGSIGKETINEKMESIQKISRNDVGVHSFNLDTLSWDSVIKYDYYFEDSIVYNEFNEFEELLKKDGEIF